MASVDEAVYMALSDGYEVVDAVEETHEYVEDDGSGEAETLQYSIKTVKRECIPEDNDDLPPKKKKIKKEQKSTFRQSWLTNPDFKPWLKPDPTDKCAAFCTVCECKMKNCSPYSLRHHQASVKHLRNLNSDKVAADGSDGDGVSEKKYYMQAFKKEWLDNPEFNTWLERHPTDKYAALCLVCNCVMKQCNKSALRRHRASSKHKNNIENAKKKSSSNAVSYKITIGNETTKLISGSNSNPDSKENPSNDNDNTFTVCFENPGFESDNESTASREESYDNESSPHKRVSEKGGGLWYQQAFKGEWLEDPEMSSWLVPDYTDKYSGYCTVCECKMKNCNKSTLKRHIKSRKHSKNLENKKKASPVSPKIGHSSTDFSSRPKKVKLEGQAVNEVAKAEFLLSRFMSDHGMPFSQADHLVAVLKKMFPDSTIARHMSVKRTNSHVMQQSIAHEEREYITRVCRENRFSLIIVDESVDIPVSQTLALMVRYFDKKRLMVTDALLDTVEVDNASSERFYFAVKDMLKEKEIPLENILGFASDNCSALLGGNDGFPDHLVNEFPNVFILGCVCHSIALCSRIASKHLSPWLESFFEEFSTYFSGCTKVPSQFHVLQEIVQSLKRKPSTMSLTEWVSRHSVISEILEKWDTLQLYFEDEATASEVTEKMNAPGIKHMLVFLNYVLGKVDKMNAEFQSKGFRLSTLFSIMSDEYRNILGMFIKDDIIQATKLAVIDPCDGNLQKSLTDLSLGGRCEALLATEPLMESDAISLRSLCLNYLMELCVQIRERFSFDREGVLSMLQILDPKEALSCHRNLKAIAKLAVHFPTIVGYGDLDILQDQWTDLLYAKEVLKCSLESPSKFWYELQAIKDGNGQARFGLLSELMCNLLALPHSSHCVERVFSQIHTIKTKRTKSLYSTSVANHLLTRQAVARQEVPNRKWESCSTLTNDVKCIECFQHLSGGNQKVLMEGETIEII